MSLAPARKSRGIVTMLGAGVGAAALVALALFASYKVQRAATQQRDEVPALAVLPFENVGRADGKEFADGMTEEITNRLASLHGLRVIGRQSAKSYAGSTKTLQQIANELGVKYVLTGTVRWDRSPDGKDLVRVSPALLRTHDATQLWAEAYQTVLSGFFDVQSKVATQVASALNLTLRDPEKAALDVKPTKNREAYSLFLRAKDIVQNTHQVGPIREAIAMLEKATTADPRFAIGWAYLAASHVELFWFGGDPTPARLTRARQALDRALSLDPDLPEVHIAHGIYLYHGERNYDAAIREFEAAQRVRPSDPDAPHYIAAIQERLGQWQESVDNFKRSIELNPRSGPNILDLASTLLMLNQFREAESYVDQGMIIAPEDPEGPRMKSQIALTYRENVPEAIEHMRNAVQTVRPQLSLTTLLLANPWPAVEDPSLKAILVNAQYSPDMTRGFYFISKANVMTYLGDITRARAYADSALPVLAREEHVSPQPAQVFVHMALAHSILGHRREALDFLARSEASLPMSLDALVGADRENAKILILLNLGDYAGAIGQMEKQADAIGGIPRSYMRLNPRFAPLRATPAFQRLVKQ